MSKQETNLNEKQSNHYENTYSWFKDKHFLISGPTLDGKAKDDLHNMKTEKFKANSSWLMHITLRHITKSNFWCSKKCHENKL